MSTYPNININLNIKPEILKTKTRDDEIKNLKYQMEKQDHETILKSLEKFKEYYRKNYKSLKKRFNYH